MFCGGSIYSYKLAKDDLKFTATHDGQEYLISISWSKSIKQGDIELFSFYSLFFKGLLKRMNFERVGRNCFNPKAAVNIAN